MQNFSVQIQIKELIKYNLKDNIFLYSKSINTSKKIKKHLLSKYKCLHEILYCFMLYNNKIDYNLFDNNIKIIDLEYILQDLMSNQSFYEGIWRTMNAISKFQLHFLKFNVWIHQIQTSLNINIFDITYILSHIHYNLYYLNFSEKETISQLENKYNKNLIELLMQELNKMLCFNKLII